MKWLELNIDTVHAALEVVENMLSQLGIDQIQISDGEEFQDFLEENKKCWDYVDDDLLAKMEGKSVVTFYLPENEEGYTLLAQVRIAMETLKAERSNMDLGAMILTLKHVSDADWENEWKQYYEPIAIGKRLMIVPEWQEADADGRVTVRLDPGLAFGTGSHATTRMCLSQLDKRVRGGERVLDIGCGSGILSIAALRLGASTAAACDIDEKAVSVAYENASLNGIGRDCYSVHAGDVLESEELQTTLLGRYDIVVANIVADVILALAPVVGGYLADDGIFLCSGIIDKRSEDVKCGLLENGFTIEETCSEDGWFAFAAKKL